MVCDDNELMEKLKHWCETNGAVNFHHLSHGQWNSNLESPQFKQFLATGVAPLISGAQGFADGGKLLQFPNGPVGPGGTSKVATMDEIESQAIQGAIMQYKGNLTEAAKALGIGRATLYRKVKQYNIDPALARKKRAA
jgi:transcriptional regulator of acetoin/glycerol metabolism